MRTIINRLNVRASTGQAQGRFRACWGPVQGRFRVDSLQIKVGDERIHVVLEGIVAEQIDS